MIGGVTATILFTNKSLAEIISAESIGLNKTELELENNSSFQLAAIIYPNNTTDKTVTWKSDNKSIAVVEAAPARWLPKLLVQS